GFGYSPRRSPASERGVPQAILSADLVHSTLIRKSTDMATNWIPVLGAVLLVALAVEAIGENSIACNMRFSDVSLSVKDGENICPFHPITLRCVVNTTVSQEPSPFLSWKCTAASADNFLICSDIVTFNCAFGKVDNIIGSCDCGGSIIVSEATFTPSSTDARTIICSDGAHEEEIPVVPRDLHTPVLNYTVISGDKRARNVTIQWATPDSAIADMEYVLSMTNISYSQSWTIRATHLNLTLHQGIHYDFTVTSQRCGGNLTSKSSSPLRVFFEGSSPTTATSKKSAPVAVVLGGVFGVIASLCVVVSAIIAVICFWKEKKTSGSCAG
ncbi:hypothetical protein GBAR_LOCUS21171, partial [Geodia barretti]